MTHERVRELIEQGMRDKDIAREVGLSRERIRQLRMKWGYAKVPASVRVVQALVDGGASLAEAAGQVGWTEGQAHARMSMIGVDIPTSYTSEIKRKREQIIILRKEGVPYTDIEEQVCVTRSMIWHTVRSNGLHVRKMKVSKSTIRKHEDQVVAKLIHTNRSLASIGSDHGLSWQVVRNIGVRRDVWPRKDQA